MNTDGLCILTTIPSTYFRAQKPQNPDFFFVRVAGAKKYNSELIFDMLKFSTVEHGPKITKVIDQPPT